MLGQAADRCVQTEIGGERRTLLAEPRQTGAPFDIVNDKELGSGLAVQKSLRLGIVECEAGRNMLRNDRFHTLKARRRQVRADAIPTGVPFAVGRERPGEIIIDPPLIGARVRIEADREERSAWLENPGAFPVDGGPIGKVVECIDTKDSLKGSWAPRQPIGASTNARSIGRASLRAREHGECGIEPDDERALRQCAG